MSSTDNEVSAIMNYLGRGKFEGNVQGTHLGQILTYLSRQKTESMKRTISKLTLVCAMTKRNLKENYIEGLDSFGVIKTKNEGHDLIWFWVGKKAFETGDLNAFVPPINLKNHCKNPSCDKEIPSGNNFCSISCMNILKTIQQPEPEIKIKTESFKDHVIGKRKEKGEDKK